jgi:hypothetical protein
MATALHAVHPRIRILNGAFDNFAPHTNHIPFSNGISLVDTESFMDGMIAAIPDVFSYLDIWASHPYPLGAFIAPPWEQTYQVDYLHGATNPAHATPPIGVFNRGINGYEWELWKLSTYGITQLPVMITETGWKHRLAHETDSPYPDEETAALYMNLAFYGNAGGYPDLPATGWTAWNNDARVIAVTPFALNGAPHEWRHTNWLDLDKKGYIQAISPIYHAFASPHSPNILD